MIKRLLLLAGVTGSLLLTACNNSKCKLTGEDSAKIYKAWGRKFVFTAPPVDPSKQNEQQTYNEVNMGFTKPITAAEAQNYITTYTRTPLTELKTSDPSNPDSYLNIRAFELDKLIVDTIRQHMEICGLRIYLGKRPDSMYTLVIVPKDAANENIMDKNWLFDWNNPCPPYCPPKAATIGN